MSKKIEEKGLVQRFKEFLIESRDELKRVSWPSRKQLTNSTKVVIIVSILSGIYIGLADSLFKMLYEYIVLK